MKIADAVNLIAAGFPEKIPGSRWADLGCGSGTFTKALSWLLGSGSRIYAVDRNEQAIISPVIDVEIEFIRADVSSDDFALKDLDGILMANSLHYIDDKTNFIKRVARNLKPDGKLIIVGYDRDRANQWVPYPIKFVDLNIFFHALGFSKVIRIGERVSIYGPEKMYASLIER